MDRDDRDVETWLFEANRDLREATEAEIDVESTLAQVKVRAATQSTEHDAPPVEGVGEMLSIVAAARRLGITPATLRTWDRRYGIGPSRHLPGRRRRYGPYDIARLELMQRALLRGLTPAEAADHALRASFASLALESDEQPGSIIARPGDDTRSAIAGDQAQHLMVSSFINLNHRFQALIKRQLALIERLEQDEQDPDRLTMLLELDHLATRIRRNSENLLVLSGTGLRRQLSRPVPASEMVRAAVSEVEHYTRVEIVSAPEVTVKGRAVSDLVHLIAELLDNATFFSGPDTKVVVRMALTRNQELAIQIADSGVGMSEKEIETANAMLADPPQLDISTTKRMGLNVVARLAKRHDITVRLRTNEAVPHGLVARITVPSTQVSTTDYVPAAETDAEPQPWVSPGDEGWQAARALLEASDSHAFTTVGMPKHVSKTNLVPGAAPSPSKPPQAKPTTSQLATGPLAWSITDFVRRVPGAAHAVLVSADGTLLASSQGLPRDRAEQLTAIVSGLISLTAGTARVFDAGAVNHTIVEMDRGYLLLIPIPAGDFCAVLAAPDCDIELVVSEMTILLEQVSQRMTPGPPAQHDAPEHKWMDDASTSRQGT